MKVKKETFIQLEIVRLSITAATKIPREENLSPGDKKEREIELSMARLKCRCLRN